MSDLLNDTKKYTTKSRETIPLTFLIQNHTNRLQLSVLKFLKLMHSNTRNKKLFFLGSATRYTTHLSSTVLSTVRCDPLLL
jgi:hypothetical protein